MTQEIDELKIIINQLEHELQEMRKLLQELEIKLKNEEV